MIPQKTADKLQTILIHQINIQPEQFDWEQPLEQLQEDFKILSYLVFLEQLLQDQFGKTIPIVENISPAFHTPKDVLNLIIKA